MPNLKKLTLLLLTLTILTISGFAQQGYQKPPQAILDVLNAPASPFVSVSPTRDKMMLIDIVRNPPIADLAQPMLRIAGLRINPNTTGPHNSPHITALTLQDIASGKEQKLSVPANAYLSAPVWSPDGKQFAFTNTVANGIELWIGETEKGSVKRISAVQINSVLGGAMQWMPDSRTLLCKTVAAKRGNAPVATTVPTGPNIQESYGKSAPIRTYQDMLKSAHDEALFEFYGTAQLALVNTSNGKITAIGTPAIYDRVDASPDGQRILTERIHKPFSYLLPADDFPKEIEVINLSGKVEYKLASAPLQDQVPMEGVQTGPRNYQWRPTEAATLIWAEALDGGDPKKKVEFRDKLMMLKAPFNAAPVEIAKTEQRLMRVMFGEKNGAVMITDYDRTRRWVRTKLVNIDDPSQTAKVIFDRSMQDRYNDPGTPMMKTLPNGNNVVMMNGDEIFLTSNGATPKGDRPFLRRFNLKTGSTEQLFRCDDNSYESVAAIISNDGSKFITRHETKSEPPNYFMRTANNPTKQALTNFKDPAPQLRQIKKQLVKYKREDGVDCSFTMYLPPDYKEGTRLPTVVWAYPLEFNDASTAGQVSGSENRFTMIGGMSHLFFVLQGYAVLDDATMPVVGDPETVNNTYVEQIVMSAKAAIDKAVEMGITDRNRVGVGGHSYGAFMTANLLAHSDLFRAGIARSGAYNRTLTPFGFQSERRTIWEAPDMYLKVSPFMYAQKIKEPILLIHGEADNNTGTFPIQSERMYQAIKGNAGNVRYVTLPFEAHGYTARESIEHTLYEMVSWFDKHVKEFHPLP